MAKKVHFIGIGGVGMSATAKLLKDSGWEVTGSDEEVYEPVLGFLRKEHIAWKSPYAAVNIPQDAELIVIGKNAKLVPESNPEVAAAFQSGKKIQSFPQVLAELAANKETIVVAGSYGKSTCAALLAHCLSEAGKDPSYFIGAIPVSSPSARLGSGKFFVIEGDEYPSSNTDPRAKFLHFHPLHTLITPLAHDHFNVFPTPADYLAPFEKLIRQTQESVVVCTEGPLSAGLIEKIKQPITYDLHDGEFQARNISWGERTSFDITHGGSPRVRVEMQLLGGHNIQNIVGVAALLFSQNLIEPARFAKAVASFQGIVRRLDRKSQKTSIPIFEGFGSSYEKAKSAIAAMKQHFPERRLVVVFEPYTINWRRAEALPQYEDVFVGAQKVLILQPPLHGKGMEISMDEVAKHTGAVLCKSAQDCLEQLDLQQNDAVLLLSSGALGGLIEAIPKMAEERFPTN
jgi:UDP-N-acetylmuramate: L-alanyl-gamma-D-glutamyl-meso-diaminopimelate ligase